MRNIAFVIVLLASYGALAQPSCVVFAQTVEAIDTMSPESRAKFMDELNKADRKDERVWLALRALNFLNAGGTKQEAWQQCPST